MGVPANPQLLVVAPKLLGQGGAYFLVLTAVGLAQSSTRAAGVCQVCQVCQACQACLECQLCPACLECQGCLHFQLGQLVQTRRAHALAHVLVDGGSRGASLGRKSVENEKARNS